MGFSAPGWRGSSACDSWALDFGHWGGGRAGPKEGAAGSGSGTVRKNGVPQKGRCYPGAGCSPAGRETMCSTSAVAQGHFCLGSDRIMNFPLFNPRG